jgi:hypothetical protein
MLERGKAPVFVGVPERYFGIDAIAYIEPVRVVFGCRKHDLGFGNISGVKVDPASHAAPCLNGEAFFDPGGIEFYR